MQAIVSESLSNDVEMTRQAKRFKKGWLENNEYVPITHKIPFTRLKLQFPNLNEEVIFLFHLKLIYSRLFFSRFVSDNFKIRLFFVWRWLKFWKKSLEIYSAQ